MESSELPVDTTSLTEMVKNTVNTTLKDMNLFTITENSNGHIKFNYSVMNDACLIVQPSQPTMLDVNGNHSIPLYKSKHMVTDHISVHSFWTGYTDILLSIVDGYCDEAALGSDDLRFLHFSDNSTLAVRTEIMILPYDGIAQRMFFYMTYAMVWLNMLIIGLENHPKIWRRDWKFFKHRILPVIARYATNPLIALILCILFGLSDNDIVTVLVLSVLPGCGLSRLMSYLYRGNKQLSYSQGFYSILASTAMLPLILLLNQLVLLRKIPVFKHEEHPLYLIHVKFLFSYLSFCLPIVPGILTRYLSHKYKCCPALIKMCQWLKPITLSIGLCVLAFGLYTHMFVFFKVSWVEFGCVLVYPLITAFVGTVFSLMSDQPPGELLTSVCEWWMHNIGMGVAISRAAMHELDAAITLRIFTPYALWIFALNAFMYALYTVVRHFVKKDHDKKEMENNLQAQRDESFLTGQNYPNRCRKFVKGSKVILDEETRKRLLDNIHSRRGTALTTSSGDSEHRGHLRKEEMVVMPDLTLIPSSHNSSKSSISDSDDQDDGHHVRTVEIERRRPSYVTFGLTFDDDESETAI